MKKIILICILLYLAGCVIALGNSDSAKNAIQSCIDAGGNAVIEKGELIRCEQKLNSKKEEK